jgi:hypothetical protein
MFLSTRVQTHLSLVLIVIDVRSSILSPLSEWRLSMGRWRLLVGWRRDDGKGGSSPQVGKGGPHWKGMPF